MKFEYRLLSEKRCNEIDSWNIESPYDYDEKLSTHGNYWVTNDNESILFCHAFSPRHDDYEGKYELFLLIQSNNYYYVRYDYDSVIDNKIDGENYRHEKIVILEDSFIENSKQKEQLIQLLKQLIICYEENSSRVRIKRNYIFEFFYNGGKV